MTTTTDIPPRTDEAGSFPDDTWEAFVVVRRAMADWVAKMPGEIRRPTDLQRTLSVGSKICWQIFNVIRSDDSISSARHVPTSNALRRALAAAERLGISTSALEAVDASVREFESVVETHAASRTDFDSMVTAMARDDSDGALELQHRRSVFRGLSHIWGTQLDLFNATSLVKRSEDGTGTDQLLLSVKRGLRRLRPDARLDVYGYRLVMPGESPTPEVTPLDPEPAARLGAPLMPEFCTQPLPRFRTFTDDEAWVNCEVEDAGIGLRSSVDLTFGVLSKNVPQPRDLDNRPWFGANSLSVTPTQMLEMNLLIHRPSFGEVSPSMLVFPNVTGSDAPQLMEKLALPLRERIVRVGRGDQIAQTPEDPHYPRLLETACARAGWNLAEFDALRVRIDYPILHAVNRLYFYLPDGK